jgi:hypothetical protein
MSSFLMCFISTIFLLPNVIKLSQDENSAVLMELEPRERVTYLDKIYCRLLCNNQIGYQRNRVVKNYYKLSLH